MSRSEKEAADDVGHAPPVSPEFVPAGTADPLPPGLGSRDQPVDCAILGGGPGGLSAALYLGRLRRASLVFDDHAARSLWSQVNWNYLGFPDGIEAAELRQRGRAQAARFGACFYDGRATAIGREAGLFCLEVAPSPAAETGAQAQIVADQEHAATLGEQAVRAPRSFYARTVIFATGVRDHFPDFVGRDECVGRTLFWCIICDGYEAVGKRVLVVGHDEEAVSTALQLRQFSNTVTLVAGRAGFSVPPARLADLATAGIEAFPFAVRDYPNDSGCVTALVLADEAGTRLPLDLIFAVTDKHPNSDLARALGVTVDALGYICADNEQKTNLEGVYAAGDVTRLHNQQISAAVHEGGQAAAAANYYLYGALQKEQHS